jgi:aldose 1-epimerase
MAPRCRRWSRPTAGKPADVLLGYDDLAGYVDHPNYFGVTVGRYANRIAGGKFTLDGKTYQLPLNDKAASLHGGGKGFDKQVWQVVSVKSGPVASVVLSHVSPDGDAGYPGTVKATVTYSLDEAGNLTIAFEASTDKPTIINMTNHAIFNLAGEGAPQGAMDHVLTIPAKAFTPVDATLIPTGELRPVAGTVFDFTKGAALSMACATGATSRSCSAVAMTTTSRWTRGLPRSPNWPRGWKTPPRAACLKC